MTSLRFHPPPRVLLICGTRHQTTAMHAVARELADCETWFTPTCDERGGALARLRSATSRAVGRRCVRYLRHHRLAIDLGGARGGYDLVVSCAGARVPTRLGGVPQIVVQDQLFEPTRRWWHVLAQRTGWRSAGPGDERTACEAYCVASAGHRRDLIARGVPAARLVVTGVPSFDDLARHRQPGHWIAGAVLACTSADRARLGYADRKRFLAWARELAGDRALVIKLHPDEWTARALAEVRRWAPHARVLVCGSGEELAANCHTLISERGTLAYVGLALGTPTHSDRVVDRALTPVQHSRAARNIAEHCRDAIARRRAGRACRGAA